ncbi:MAG TPA: carbohydrate ABC transporter permease [Hydrogenispora sp.]|nr:carbohydrate ABC transporter permease [Hydrogenispora sp.]
MPLIYLVLTTGLFLSIFPYLWMVLSSFKVSGEIFTRFWPSKLTLSNYAFILQGGTGQERNFVGSIVNSLIITIIPTISVVFFGMLTAYALRRLKVRGYRYFENIIIYQMLFPGVLFLIPLFLMMRDWGMINNYSGMILRYLIDPWAIFIYIQFFKTIPESLLEAARIDGASEIKIITRIMLPLSKTTTAIVILFTFMARWGEFLWPLIVNKNYDKMPLSVLLALFTKGEYKTYPGVQMAGATLLTLPIVVLFLVFRRYFEEGISFTGLKG